MYLINKITLLIFLLTCTVSCSGEVTREQKYISDGTDFLEKSMKTITGKYYSAKEGGAKTGTLRMINIKSFTKDRVVYDFVEYEFNRKPSDIETMTLLGEVAALDTNSDVTIQRRMARLPKPFGITGVIGTEQRGVEAPLTMGKLNNKALSCYRYLASTPQSLIFEFCENGYRGINSDKYLHQESYGPTSLIGKILEANPGFPEKLPPQGSIINAKTFKSIDPQSAVSDTQYDGEIIGRAAVCLDSMGQLSREKGLKIGTEYMDRLIRIHGREISTPLFYILKEALIVGEKNQRKEGLANCEKRIADFDELVRDLDLKASY